MSRASLLRSMLISCLIIKASSFITSQGSLSVLSSSSITTKRMATMANYLTEPKERKIHYGTPLNAAQYLVDLHDAKATFNFCGGMIFQFVLSEKLRDYLVNIVDENKGAQQPEIY